MPVFNNITKSDNDFQVKIINTKSGNKYIACCELECKDTLDAIAYKMVIESGDKIYLDPVTASPV